jgi:hypothetical protein
MSRAEYYRRKAAEARKMAEASRDEGVKAAFRQAEYSWLELADNEERRSKPLGE